MLLSAFRNLLPEESGFRVFEASFAPARRVSNSHHFLQTKIS